jgi:hypothetical protein
MISIYNESVSRATKMIGVRRLRVSKLEVSVSQIHTMPSMFSVDQKKKQQSRMCTSCVWVESLAFSNLGRVIKSVKCRGISMGQIHTVPGMFSAKSVCACACVSVCASMCRVSFRSVASISRIIGLGRVISISRVNRVIVTSRASRVITVVCGEVGIIIAETHRTHLLSVTRVLQECHKSVTRLLQECHKSARVLQYPHFGIRLIQLRRHLRIRRGHRQDWLSGLAAVPKQ